MPRRSDVLPTPRVQGTMPLLRWLLTALMCCLAAPVMAETIDVYGDRGGNVAQYDARWAGLAAGLGPGTNKRRDVKQLPAVAGLERVRGRRLDIVPGLAFPRRSLGPFLKDFKGVDLASWRV